MDLLQHTTYEEVRSLLGVTPKELADSVIALPHWTLAVEQELLDIDGGAGAVMSTYATVYALAEGTRTAAQTQFFKVVNMLVLYEIGYELLQRADVFSPTDISDGKASIKRLEARFDKLRPAIEGGLQRLLARVKDALAVLVPAAAIATTPDRVMILSSAISRDPVTGV